MGESKNTAMKYVSADYVMFLDSDDYISPTIIENSLNLIKTNNCDLLIFNWQRVPEDEYSIHKPNIIENKVIKSISEKPSLIFYTSSWGKIFHKNLYKYLKFPLRIYEDNVSSLETLFNANRIFLFKEIGYFYRKTDQSITNKINLTNTLDLSFVIKNLFKLAEKHPEYDKYIKALILRFCDDIIFWLNYYDWFYLEELEIVQNLQNAMLNSLNEEDIEFYYSIASLKIVYPDIIQNILNYDSETFLAKYKYLLNSSKVNPVASLYIDTGNGFNEDDKISVEYNLSRINDLTFDLTDYDNINLLRFDPLEGDFISSKIIKTTPISNRIDVNSHNSLLDEYQTFYTLDPNYVIEGDFENIKCFNIQFELNILNNKQLSDILLSQNNQKENEGFLKKLLR